LINLVRAWSATGFHRPLSTLVHCSILQLRMHAPDSRWWCTAAVSVWAPVIFSRPSTMCMEQHWVSGDPPGAALGVRGPPPLPSPPTWYCISYSPMVAHPHLTETKSISVSSILFYRCGTIRALMLTCSSPHTDPNLFKQSLPSTILSPRPFLPSDCSHISPAPAPGNRKDSLSQGAPFPGSRWRR